MNYSFIEFGKTDGVELGANVQVSNGSGYTKVHAVIKLNIFAFFIQINFGSHAAK